MSKNIRRILNVDLRDHKSAFLWGPRKVGKSFWIKHQFIQKDDWYIDLLKTDIYAEYVSRPSLLRERWIQRQEAQKQPRITIIDEIQKIPSLLDEVHWLIENKEASFLLTGSSARKLRRGHANLLGGRAWRLEMGPLSYIEIKAFDLQRAVLSGTMPSHYLSSQYYLDLKAYIADYLKEEIAQEAAVRNIPAFSEFLKVAAITNSEFLNYTNVARESGVSAKVVRNYFQILEDTLLGFRLAPWKKSKNRRMITTEKFYFFDMGVANFLSKRKPQIGGSEFGKSFEHFILLEILNYRRCHFLDFDVCYWRAASGVEVDFVLGDMDVAIEVKSSARIHKGHIKHIELLRDEFSPKHSIVVSMEKEARRLKSGILILPWQEFIARLWAGDFVK